MHTPNPIFWKITKLEWNDDFISNDAGIIAGILEKKSECALQKSNLSDEKGLIARKKVFNQLETRKGLKVSLTQNTLKLYAYSNIWSYINYHQSDKKCCLCRRVKLNKNQLSDRGTTTLVMDIVYMRSSA